ncbi:tRNA (guanosine(18)-2'-O)-methyltransferase TrmH [Parahaliea maris]|uniref:tRNA (guanosine(18)-2'-O)-methyltransferase n=1 Tax=Parahaliea maris TaxID=2716870 RepID=A0A5C9A5U1_9GAMM|nr:tRNA (guanosine(18)-2'-O)-methyltransferase TrmH [Parahaliea maris]TXS96293.1 tRNA (guanosine(18)-2'-O)-methyltransferase TrmH [Parahaliea maris]
MTPERSARLRAVLERRQPDLTLVTDFVNKQRNLSAIVRNCDAAGIMAIHAVLGEEDYRAFRGTAMGSHRWVEVHRHAAVDEAISGLQAQGYQVLAAHLGEGARDYREIDYCKPTAVLLGAERRGVSVEARARVDGFITVPMMGMVESYNVSVASGIILAEAQRQRAEAGLYDQCRIDRATYRRLLFEWAYPDLVEYCTERGLAYPPIDEAGDLVVPSAWYAAVREGRAPLAGESEAH